MNLLIKIPFIVYPGVPAYLQVFPSAPPLGLIRMVDFLWTFSTVSHPCLYPLYCHTLECSFSSLSLLKVGYSCQSQKKLQTLSWRLSEDHTWRPSLSPSLNCHGLALTVLWQLLCPRAMWVLFTTLSLLWVLQRQELFFFLVFVSPTFFSLKNFIL